jgi:hypothetical protein
MEKVFLGNSCMGKLNGFKNSASGPTRSIYGISEKQNTILRHSTEEKKKKLSEWIIQRIVINFIRDFRGKINNKVKDSRDEKSQFGSTNYAEI